MQRAIVVGCSTGIGHALALELDRRGWTVGLAGRDMEKMEELKRLMKPGTALQRLDVTDESEAPKALRALISDLGGCELVVVNAGVGEGNRELDWKKQRPVILTNVLGFTRVADEAFKYFTEKGRGHLAGVSSVAATRGYWHAPAYNASKAYVSNYLEGLRALACGQRKLPITVTDIKPGFVATPMTEGNPRMFWVVSAEAAARMIADALESGREHAYIPSRWGLVACLIKLMPESIYKRR